MTRRNLHGRTIAALIVRDQPLPADASPEDRAVIQVAQAAFSVAYEKTYTTNFPKVLNAVAMSRNACREAGNHLDAALAVFPKIARRKGSAAFYDDAIILLEGIAIRLGHGRRP